MTMENYGWGKCVRMGESPRQPCQGPSAPPAASRPWQQWCPAPMQPSPAASQQLCRSAALASGLRSPAPPCKLHCNTPFMGRVIPPGSARGATQSWGMRCDASCMPGAPGTVHPHRTCRQVFGLLACMQGPENCLSNKALHQARHGVMGPSTLAVCKRLSKTLATVILHRQEAQAHGPQIAASSSTCMSIYKAFKLYCVRLTCRKCPYL